MTKVRWLLVIAVICVVVLVVGYRLTQPEPETVAAAPVPPVPAQTKTESLSAQATTIEEVEARSVLAVVEPMTLLEAEQEYHVNYPVDWETLTPSTTMTVLKSPDGESIVKVEAVGPVPADGLAPFVDRSLGSEMVFSRQLLTVHGLPAERIVAYSDTVGGQITTFYIDNNGTIFTVTGVGEQKAIEMIARSFNAPQVVAQR